MVVKAGAKALVDPVETVVALMAVEVAALAEVTAGPARRVKVGSPLEAAAAAAVGLGSEVDTGSA